MTFGEKLRESRKRKGYTQEQTAAMLGVAKSTYTGYEKGVREPDLFKIKRLIEILGFDSSWLLGVDESSDTVSAAEYQAIKKYRALDARGKAAVDSTLSREYAACASIAAAADAAQTVKDINSTVLQTSAATK